MAGRALLAGFGLLVLASCSSSEDDLELDLDDRSTSAQSTEFESTEFESTESLNQLSLNRQKLPCLFRPSLPPALQLSPIWF